MAWSIEPCEALGFWNQLTCTGALFNSWALPFAFLFFSGCMSNQLDQAVAPRNTVRKRFHCDRDEYTVRI
jgi:hypothetical protein